MKALVKYAKGPGNLEIRDVSKPEITSPDDVLVRVKLSSVDRGADLNVYNDREGMPYSVPIILGNEACGEVIEVGTKVKKWKRGDRVVPEMLIYFCGDCFWCRTGDGPRCPHKIGMGRQVDGTFAEYFKTKARYLHRVPDVLSWEEAVLAENVAVVVNNIVEKTNVCGGDIVAIIGPGPIGQIASQVSKASGASRTIVLGAEGDDTRLHLAKELGADEIINISERDPIDAVKEFTDKRGADVVVEASGSSNAPELAFDLVRPSGKIAQIGHYYGKVSVTWEKLLTKNITIYGAQSHRWSAWQRALNMMSSGQISVKRLLSKKFPLEEWQEAFRLVEKDRNMIKVALAA